MSENQLNSFLEAVKSDSGLQKRLRDARSPEAVVAVAKQADFVISVHDVKGLMQEHQLSDDEVEGLDGGYRPDFPPLDQEIDLI